MYDPYLVKFKFDCVDTKSISLCAEIILGSMQMLVLPVLVIE